MNVLRWGLGLSSTLLAIGWVALAIAADDFRRSFGASPTGAAKVVAPLALLIVVALGTMFPRERWLLHLGAALGAVALVGCGFVLRESVATALFGFAYLAAWFVYYSSVVARGAPPP